MNSVISNKVRDLAPIQTKFVDYGRSLPAVKMTIAIQFNDFMNLNKSYFNLSGNKIKYTLIKRL